MEVVSNRLHAGLAWVTSSSINLLNSTLFDSLAVPFTDSSPSTQTNRQPLDTLAEAQAAGNVIYVDRTGQQITEEEFESLNRGNFSDSPWGFVASRYALTLGIMAVVVNRITHICRPQGRPRPLSNPRRLAIQLPTMMFLAWSGLMLFLVTLNSFSESQKLLNNINGFSWLPSDVHTLIDSEANESDIHTANSALLWRLFLSVCLAVVSSTLLRTLEGHNTVVNPDDLGNSPTFNLVGFAVLLHLHASSYTFPPNKHVYLSILFQVGEVLGLQACTCWTTPPVSRLTLTSVFGLTSTLHYLHAIRSGDRGYPFLQGFSRAPDLGLIAIIFLTLSLHAFTALITSTPLSFSRLVDPRSLPLPTDDYSLALFKLGTACLSSTRLSGLDSDLIDINTSREPWIEVDEGQVRVRNPARKYIASDEQGGRNGFDNEIRRIKSTKVRDSRHPFRSNRWQQRFRFLVVLMRTIRGLSQWFGSKIVALLPFNLPQIRIPRWMQKVPRLIRLAWHGSNGEERRRVRLEEQRRQRERQDRIRADQALRDRMDGAGRAFGSSTSGVSSSINANQLKQRGRALSPALRDAPPNSWQRYFQQEFVEESDAEDGEWREDEEVEEIRNPHDGQDDRILPSGENAYWQKLGSGSRLVEGEQDRDEDDDLDEEEDDAWQDELNPGDVSAELLTLARRDFEEDGANNGMKGDDSYARILMAHMANDEQKILTRRGYRELIGGFVGTDEHEDIRILADVIHQRRNMNNVSSRSSSTERERMRLCVICYAEDRTIICWPCKCLALCDGCREAMAARPPPRNHQHHRHQNGTGTGFFGGVEGEGGGHPTATHTCPTCRTPVIGFSRVFLP